MVREINWYEYGSEDNWLNAFEKLNDKYYKQYEEYKKELRKTEQERAKRYKLEGSDFYFRQVNELCYRNWNKNAYNLRRETD